MASLNEILAMLWTRAERCPGDPQRQVLEHRLRVEVKCEKGLVLLQISRANTWPADQELETVLRCWPSPQPPSNLQALRRFYLRRYYLLASWPAPVRLLKD